MSTVTYTTTPTVKTPFFPPKFSNIGKSSSDLFKRKYNFTHQLRSVNKTIGKNVTFESGLQSLSSPYHGYILAQVSRPRYEVEARSSTNPAQPTTITSKFPGVAPGLNVNTTLSIANSTISGTTVEAEYSRESFTAHSIADVLQQSGIASATVGSNGISVGASVAADFSKGADIRDYNFGVEYNGGAYTASLITEQRLDTAVVGYTHKISPIHTAGASLRVEIGNGMNSTLSLGNDYTINPSTSIKSKVDLPSGTVSSALEHRLNNPSVALTFAAAFTPSNLFANTFKADKFGLNVVLGDY